MLFLSGMRATPLLYIAATFHIKFSMLKRVYLGYWLSAASSLLTSAAYELHHPNESLHRLNSHFQKYVLPIAQILQALPNVVEMAPFALKHLVLAVAMLSALGFP